MSERDLIYHEHEWEPHGLSCARCPHVFSEGEQFTSLLYAFQDDVPMLLLVCLGCLGREGDE